jgi:hypothetical protein
MLNMAQKWASASIGALLLGNMEVRFFLRAFLFRGIFMRFSTEMHTRDCKHKPKPPTSLIKHKSTLV